MCVVFQIRACSHASVCACVCLCGRACLGTIVLPLICVDTLKTCLRFGLDSSFENQRSCISQQIVSFSCSKTFQSLKRLCCGEFHGDSCIVSSQLLFEIGDTASIFIRGGQLMLCLVGPLTRCCVVLPEYKLQENKLLIPVFCIWNGTAAICFTSATFFVVHQRNGGWFYRPELESLESFLMRGEITKSNTKLPSKTSTNEIVFTEVFPCPGHDSHNVGPAGDKHASSA